MKILCLFCELVNNQKTRLIALRAEESVMTPGFRSSEFKSLHSLTLEDVKGVKCKNIPYYQLLAIPTKEVNTEKVEDSLLSFSFLLMRTN